jgi:hypothetical protein
MKTPRDILLAHHRAAEAKLDAVRDEVIAGLNREKTKAPNPLPSFAACWLGGSNKLWRELIFPCRRIWAGLAAAWVLIFLVNFSIRDHSPTVMAKAPALEMMSFREQQRLLNELLADRSPPADSERPKPFLPRSRSERIEILAT